MAEPVNDKRTTVSVARLLARIQAGSILSIVSALREGFLALDPELRIMTMNPAAETILGRSRDELAGVSVCDLLGEAACPQDLLIETLRSGEPVFDFQTTVRLSDGRRGHVVLRTVPLKNRNGSDLGIGLLLGDVTEITTLLQEKTRRHRLGRLVGRDHKMRKLFDLVTDVADSEATVLVYGESGTGKELVARALHESSVRADGPFVQVNCSALSENLLESELFGHVKGAYTGAVADRRGRFEDASGGTLFLDEIGDVSPVVQVKLLRVLQERVIERVGENRPVPVNVRLVSATNRDLQTLLATGRMREDFFYRIKVVSLAIPPLRERREDIPLLVANFLDKYLRREEGRQRPQVTGEAMAALMNHVWPGNVRELENALEHALVLSRGRPIRAEHLPPEVRRAVATGDGSADPRPGRRRPVDRETALEALQATGWNRSRAARRLGIDRTTLWRKIKEFGLQPED